MSEESISEPKTKTIFERLNIQSRHDIFLTLIYTIVGLALFIVLSMIPMPYFLVSLFKFGLIPALAIIAVVAAIRGPLAGLLTGYLGVFLYDLVIRSTIVALGLPALGYGILGLIVGLTTYDFTNGKSLAKLSILSAVGYMFTVLIVVAVGLTIESYATLVALGFVLLPLLTVGLPSIILITPLFARLYHCFKTKFASNPEE